MWERLPLPTNAGLLAVSPDSGTLLLNWNSENSGGYSNEASALWTTSAPEPWHQPQRWVPETDRYFLQTKWIPTHGIAVRYFEGTQARIALIQEHSFVPLELDKWSALSFDVSPNGVLAGYFVATDSQPKLGILDLNAEKPSLQCVDITHLANEISFQQSDDAAVQQWAWGRQRTICWNSDDGTSIEGVLYLPDDFSEDRHYPLLVIAHGGPGLAELMVRRD